MNFQNYRLSVGKALGPSESFYSFSQVPKPLPKTSGHMELAILREAIPPPANASY